MSTQQQSKNSNRLRARSYENTPGYDDGAAAPAPQFFGAAPVADPRGQRPMGASPQNVPIMNAFIAGGGQPAPIAPEEWETGYGSMAPPPNAYAAAGPPVPPPAYAHAGYGGTGFAPAPMPYPPSQPMWTAVPPPPQAYQQMPAPAANRRSPLRTGSKSSNGGGSPMAHSRTPVMTSEMRQAPPGVHDAWNYSPEGADETNALLPNGVGNQVYTTTTTTTTVDMTVPFDGSGGGGYGSMSNAPAPLAPQPPPVLNKKSRSRSFTGRSDKSGREGGSSSQPSTPTNNPDLRKIASGNDLQKMANKSHRRTASDSGRRTKGGLPPFLPPKGRGALPPHPLTRRSSAGASTTITGGPMSSNRPRSLSGSSSRHRRADSAGSVASMASVLSERSVVSDISRSVMYKEVTDSGIIRLRLPVDNVHLVMAEDGLESGVVYQSAKTERDYERFFAYHMRSDEQMDGTDLMFLDEDEALPETSYALAVDHDLYRRVLSEISDSKNMPCGLFFCGHHEDVHRPSIMIAVTIVGFVFVVLVVLTFFVPAY